jgi:mono/diheme cytochrome c family protein
MNKITIYKEKFNSNKFASFLLAFLLIQSVGFAQNGKDIFKANCAACHSLGANKLVGPGLEGVNSRRERDWLVSWTENSQKMVEAGDADAVALFDEYKIPMQSFEGVLSKEDINAVFDYVENPTESEGVAEEAGAPVADAGSSDLELAGQKLFKANCAACHSVGANKVVGPGLQGVNEKREKEWLVKWITNSGDLIASGDADAQAIFAEYNNSIMPPQAVSEEDITAILAYIKNPPVKKGAKKEVVADAGAEEKDSSTMMYLLIGVIVVFGGLLFMINRSRVSISRQIAANEGREFDGPVTLIDALKFTLAKNKVLVVLLIFIMFFASLVNLMDGAFTIGVHEGYKPEQPIKFSHKIHAGDNKVDCNYCHSSARHSKTSGIPSLNVCMNCHKYVNGGENKFVYDGEEYPMSEEIKKIYKHLDYDPNTQEYGDNPTPVKWVKVHNLPDHVFFSHQQHVVAGKQKCQTCHGPVEEMDVVEQHSQLTMKWCIECHQNSSVATEGNGYYEDMHSRMTDEYKEKVLGDGKLTVEENGGWECAKCHY